DPGRTQQGEEATARIPQQPVDRLELLSPSHERRPGGREVRAARVERLERREAGGKAVDLELVDPLRSAQILEPVWPQVPDLGVDQGPRGLGEEHLPAVAGGGDTRTLVDVEADVAFLGKPGLPRVEP